MRKTGTAERAGDQRHQSGSESGCVSNVGRDHVMRTGDGVCTGCGAPQRRLLGHPQFHTGAGEGEQVRRDVYDIWGRGGVRKQRPRTCGLS